MKRKLIALSSVLCLVLSSCTVMEDTPEQTTAVTPLTLTESITEESSFIPEPEEEEPEPSIILAVYDPFSHVPKPDDTVYRELSEAVEAIGNARAFLYANPTAFYMGSEYFTDYADTSVSLEHSDEMEYDFCPVNPEFAGTEDELFDRLRVMFTENYISDDELREELFAPASYDGQPNYKTIDGTLCLKCQYNGVMVSLYTDEMTVLSYDENSAEVAVLGYGAAYPPYHVFMTLKRSESGTWRLDGNEYKEYNDTEAQLLYNVITLNTEKLNRILEGGNTPDDPTTIEYAEGIYIETDLDMTIEEMRDFFKDIFFEYTLDETSDGYAVFLDSSLLQKCLNKYIYDVYLEESGKLFRRSDAPRWYLPELELDPYSDELEMRGSMIPLFGENGGGIFTWKQPFRNESGDIQNRTVTICYKYAKDSYDYSHIYIGSELPVLEHKD